MTMVIAMQENNKDRKIQLHNDGTVTAFSSLNATHCRAVVIISVIARSKINGHSLLISTTMDIRLRTVTK